MEPAAWQGRLAALMAEYAEESTGKLDEIQRALDRFEAGDFSALDAVRIGFHSLAGSGGTYGLEEVSRIAAQADRSSTAAAAGGPACIGEWRDSIGSLRAELRHARSRSATA